MGGTMGFAGCGPSGGSAAVVATTDDAGAAPGAPALPDGAVDVNLAVRPDPAFPLFDDSRLHEIELTMAPADWQSIIDDSRGDEERHAIVTFDGVVVPDVGVRPSGESSRFAGNQKMSVRVKFDAFPNHGTFGGIKELKLKGQWDDTSMMRDRLAYFVYRSIIPAPREGDAHLVVNGDPRGLYAVVQVWNRESITEHFQEPVGPLYRVRGGVNDPYKYLGPDANAYMPLPWEPHIDHPSRGDDVIGAFLGAIAASPANLEGVMDVDTLLGYLAATTLIMNTDGMVGDSGVEDHFQYFDPVTGKFFTLPWDPDNTFGSHGEKPDRSIYTHFSHTVPTVIVRDSTDLARRYRAKIRDTIAAAPPDKVQAEAERTYQLIKDAVYADTVKRGTNGSFDWSLGYIKDFIAQRYAFVQGQAGP